MDTCLLSSRPSGRGIKGGGGENCRNPFFPSFVGERRYMWFAALKKQKKKKRLPRTTADADLFIGGATTTEGGRKKKKEGKPQGGRFRNFSFSEGVLSLQMFADGVRKKGGRRMRGRNSLRTFHLLEGPHLGWKRGEKKKKKERKRKSERFRPNISFPSFLGGGSRRCTGRKGREGKKEEKKRGKGGGRRRQFIGLSLKGKDGEASKGRAEINYWRGVESEVGREGKGSRLVGRQ